MLSVIKIAVVERAHWVRWVPTTVCRAADFIKIFVNKATCFLSTGEFALIGIQPVNDPADAGKGVQGSDPRVTGAANSDQPSEVGDDFPVFKKPLHDGLSIFEGSHCTAQPLVEQCNPQKW